MKIEPLGVERDRQIAELRGGNKWDTCSQVKEGLCLSWVSDTDPCDECHRTPYKPYSTDIASAMELWGEMKGAGDIDLDYKKRRDNCFCRLGIGGEPHEDYDIEISHFGETEADAISGVYVGWKGGDNG